MFDVYKYHAHTANYLFDRNIRYRKCIIVCKSVHVALLTTNKSKSLIKIIYNKGPNTDPCGTAVIMSIQELKSAFVFNSYM